MSGPYTKCDICGQYQYREKSFSGFKINDDFVGTDYGIISDKTGIPRHGIVHECHEIDMCQDCTIWFLTLKHKRKITFVDPSIENELS